MVLHSVSTRPAADPLGLGPPLTQPYLGQHRAQPGEVWPHLGLVAACYTLRLFAR
jgi:hypothetical protein